MCPVGSVVKHKNNSDFGYGIVVFSFPESSEGISHEEDAIAVVLWHGDEERSLTETPQVHPYSDLKILNTTVGFA